MGLMELKEFTIEFFVNLWYNITDWQECQCNKERRLIACHIERIRISSYTAEPILTYSENGAQLSITIYPLMVTK